MKVELSQPFAANSKVDEFDVKQTKKALNRLGYYQPYEKVGITGIADMGVFDALRAFQKDHDLTATGSVKPDDETVSVLNKEASKTPDGRYIWRTVEDEKVRKGHPPIEAGFYDESVGEDLNYYGEVSIHFHGGGAPLLLSISEGAFSRLHQDLQGEAEFVTVESLANQTVVIRTKAISDLYFSSEAYDD